MLHCNFRAEFFERLDVQIDRTRADGAAAGQGNAGVAEARHQRPQRQHRSAHRLHQFVGRLGVRDRFRLNREFARRHVGAFDPAAHVREQFRHGDDVAHVRNILQAYRFAGEQRRGHGGQGRVLRAADLDRAFELSPALYLESIHVTIPWPFGLIPAL